MTAATKARFKQIAGYVDIEERARFALYCSAYGISASFLLNLLVRRELEFDRLGILCNAHLRRSCSRKGAKVIAHLENSILNEHFAEHAKAYGLSVASAAAVLVRAELSERWFDQAFRLRPTT